MQKINTKNREKIKNKLIVISEKNNYEKIKKELINELKENYKIIFLNNLNKKINNEKILFIIKNNYEEIKKYKKIIYFIQTKNNIEKNKINILFLENNFENKNNIDLKILKNIFKKYIILGKIKTNK